MNQKILRKEPSLGLSRGLARGILLMIACLSFSFAQAQTTVRGNVVDETGSAMPGVNIVVKNTAQGTTTDAEGNYVISASDGSQTLVFSFIGYAAVEEVIGNRSNINVSMQLDAAQLSEVVVIGYGVQRQEAVTGSVASINGNDLREVPAGNITQALQGRLAGVEISQTSSQPGASMQILIRGKRSLTASNEPLVVLDGIPFVGTIGDINPNDIKSIDILKDASATAIYGSRGANGVILVTTNKGQFGQKPRISYNGFTGLKEVFGKFPMMSGPDMVKLRELNIPYNTYGQDEAEDVDTDWQDLMYRTGVITSHDVTLSNGTANGAYNFGIGYFLDQAVIPTQQYSRISLRGTVDQEIGNHFRFGFTTNSNANLTQGSQVNVGGLLRMTPVADPFNPDGSWKRTVRTTIDEPWVYSREIVEGLEDEWLNETRGFASYNSLYGEVKIPWVEGLKYRLNVGLDYRQSNGGTYTGEGVTSTNPTTQSVASISNSQTHHWLAENIVSYDRKFGDHEINAIALYSAEQNKFNRSRIVARDIPADQFQFYNLGQAAGEITVAPDEQWYQVWGLMSWMGRAMYSYKDRYMLTATLRSDGSSRLAEGHKWQTYPAVSVGWNISQESFMSGVTPINMLKLRVGYGLTSNQAVDPYETLGNLATRPYNFGSEYSTGLYVNQLPNPLLGWEFSKTANFGLDFAVLNNRLSGTIEYYISNTENLLFNKGLPPTSGVSSVTENIGRSKNSGIELSLNGTIIDNRNGWTWEAGLNLYANRNELVSLTSGLDRNEANWWFVGHPIDVIYDYEAIGLWQAEDPHRDVLEPGGNNIGMIKVKYAGDFEPDGTPTRAIDAQDRQIMSMLPNFQGGFNTRVSYKGFDLSVVGLFKSGGILNSTLYGGGGYLNLLNGRNGNVDVDYWTTDNTDAKYPNPESVRSGDNLKYANTMGYFDASFLKIRTITLGYDFNQLRSSNVNLRVYFTAQNPFVMFSPYHKESGMDPETNSFGNENAAVNLSQNLSRILTLGTNTPSTRNYLIGLNLTF